MQTPLRDEDGYNGEELNAAEERLGFKLPAALREAYMLFGRRTDLCGTMNFLQPPDQLDTYEDTGLLTYHAENQGAWERYIRPADLYVEDPPVTHASGVMKNTSSASPGPSGCPLQSAGSPDWDSLRFRPMSRRARGDIAGTPERM